MGARVDVFVIRGKEVQVRYSHWGADSPGETLLACTRSGLDLDDVREGPMADCFAEMAVIVEPERKILWWESDHDDEGDVEIPGWDVRRLSCYCGIYFELQRRGLWKWPRPKQDACMLLDEDDGFEQVEAELRGGSIEPAILPELLPLGQQMLEAGAEVVLEIAPPWVYRPRGFAFYPCPCCGKPADAEVVGLEVDGRQQWVGEPVTLDVLHHVELQLPTALAGQPLRLKVRSRSKGRHLLHASVRVVVARPASGEPVDS